MEAGVPLHHSMEPLHCDSGNSEAEVITVLTLRSEQCKRRKILHFISTQFFVYFLAGDIPPFFLPKWFNLKLRQLWRNLHGGWTWMFYSLFGWHRVAVVQFAFLEQTERALVQNLSSDSYRQWKTSRTFPNLSLHAKVTILTLYPVLGIINFVNVRENKYVLPNSCSKQPVYFGINRFIRHPVL